MDGDTKLTEQYLQIYVLLYHVIVLKRAGKQEAVKLMKQTKTSVAKQKPWRKDEQTSAFGRETEPSMWV